MYDEKLCNLLLLLGLRMRRWSDLPKRALTVIVCIRKDNVKTISMMFDNYLILSHIISRTLSALLFSFSW